SSTPFAKSVNDGSSSLCSMRRQTFATIAAFSASTERPSGLQRLQARKPVALAASRVSWNLTFLGFAALEGHEGRQKNPVFSAGGQKCAGAVLSGGGRRAWRGA